MRACVATKDKISTTFKNRVISNETKIKISSSMDKRNVSLKTNE
jgi:hypothetical protein